MCKLVKTEFGMCSLVDCWALVLTGLETNDCAHNPWQEVGGLAEINVQWPYIRRLLSLTYLFGARVWQVWQSLRLLFLITEISLLDSRHYVFCFHLSLIRPSVHSWPRTAVSSHTPYIHTCHKLTSWQFTNFEKITLLCIQFPKSPLKFR